MIRTWYYCTLLYGLVGVLISSGWLVFHLPSPPKAEPVEHKAEVFYADPTKLVYHKDPDCPLLNCTNPGKITGLAAAEAFGYPCEHCLQELVARHRSPVQQAR